MKLIENVMISFQRACGQELWTVFSQLLNVDNEWGNWPSQLLANSKVNMATFNTIDLIITFFWINWKWKKYQKKSYNRVVSMCGYKEGWEGEETGITTSTD